MFRRPLGVNERGCRGICATAALLCGLFAGSHRSEAQWLQWGGPERNFIAKAPSLAEKWPEDGPKSLWNRELGDGYGTILVDGDVLFAMYRIEQDEFSVALDAKTGKTLWEHKNPSPTTQLMEAFGPGPSSTPLVLGERLYTVGTNMVFHCFNKKTGDVLWKHDLVKEFGAKVPGRGYSCSPIRYADTIILPVGSEEGKGRSLVAFHRDSGSVVWKNQDFEITHSSPIVIRFNGQDQLVYFTAESLVGMNPDGGALLWTHPHKTQYGANLMTPFWNGTDLLFCSAAYDSGARVVKLDVKDGKTVPEELWYSRKMRIHHGNAIGVGDYIYGSSGDFGPAFFMAMNMRTGKVAWRNRGFKKATCVLADGKFIILDEEGHLALATATPDDLTVHSKCKITEPYSWAAPTLVDKTLYVRDRKHIMALDLG